MRFSIALIATAYAVTAINLDAATEQQEYDQEHKSFDIGPHYQAPSYTEDYTSNFPGADYNRQVYNFDSGKNVWNQEDYNERVKVEAELLVALEALKEAATYLNHDLDEINTNISINAGRIGSNQDDIYENQTANLGLTNAAQDDVHNLQDTCRYTQHELDTNKDALILFCQQFAFAHAMVPACSALLTCRETQLYYGYHFSGSDVHHNHDHAHSYVADESYTEAHKDTPLSSHGMKLNVTGGHVHAADLPYNIDPELAAAAVNPSEAVLQVDGQSILAPLSQIDASKVELACDDTGCVLIPDDGDSSNDLLVGGHTQADLNNVDHSHDGHDHATVYHALDHDDHSNDEHYHGDEAHSHDGGDHQHSHDDFSGSHDDHYDGAHDDFSGDHDLHFNGSQDHQFNGAHDDFNGSHDDHFSGDFNGSHDDHFSGDFNGSHDGHFSAEIPHSDYDHVDHGFSGELPPQDFNSSHDLPHPGFSGDNYANQPLPSFGGDNYAPDSFGQNVPSFGGDNYAPDSFGQNVPSFGQNVPNYGLDVNQHDNSGAYAPEIAY